MRNRPAAWLGVAGLLLAGCSQASGGERTIVASIYPLAFAAERIAGPDWEVIDLTVSGAEPHDLELALEQRAAIHDAEVVLYLGDIGFQPQVEQAVAEATGVVATVGMIDRSSEGVTDPHFWLAPDLMGDAGLDISRALLEADPDADVFLEAYSIQMDNLARRYAASLETCRYRTMIVSHEAFGYLADLFDLEEFGLSGITPEAEPTAKRLAEARELITTGEAGAIFYEGGHENARRVVESFARDADVPALPLSTLETHPVHSDYYDEMGEVNLESLRTGLQCE